MSHDLMVQIPFNDAELFMNPEPQAIIIAALLCAGLSYFYWGLGVALGPIIAVYFAKEAERNGIQLDFLFYLTIV